MTTTTTNSPLQSFINVKPANDDFCNNILVMVNSECNFKKRISVGSDGLLSRVTSPVSEQRFKLSGKPSVIKVLRRNANSKKMQKAVFKQQFEAFKISNSEGLEKGYDRFQQLLSQLEAHGAEVSTEDANHKFLRSLPSAWSNLAMTMRTNPEIDNLSIDDLYNNLRVFEQEIQGAPKPSSSAQNVAFVSQSKSSTNKVKSGFSGAYSSCTPSTSSTNVPEKEVLAGFADEVIYSLFAKQTEDLDLLHEDLEQIDDVDIEEMDINWQIAMIAIRMKKFYKKTGRRVRVDGKTPAKGTYNGKKKRDSLYQHQEAGKQEKIQEWVVSKEDSIGEAFISVDLQRPQDFKERSQKPEIKLCAYDNSSEHFSTVNPIDREGFVKYLLSNLFETDSIKFMMNHIVSHIVDLDLSKLSIVLQRLVRSVWTNANRVNHANQFVPRSVQLNTGRPKLNSVRPNINTGRTNINSVSPKVNTVRSKQPVPNKTSNSSSPKRPQMNQMNQRRDFSKSYSSVRRPFANSTAQMANSNAVMGRWGSAVKTSASYTWRNSRPNFNYNSGPTSIRTEHPLKNMVDRGIFDSGCSGHMTGNKDQLEDFEEFNGGSVTFGGSKGYISGKGRIRVGNLDFDSVSFVKELGHFNLFSISQICDKQHKVLFTETECLVVSSDFKMPDENQILLKVPRHHNMYSFDIKTPKIWLK
ncbi:hypothetical protein Tco_0423986 [Tanacetum coccineum]